MADDAPDLAPPRDGLSVEFVTVEELYAGSYSFHLPWFQRAYAWTDDLALRLLNDIHQAQIDRSRRYFIGHVLLARKSGDDRHDLVDGQQRAVTLMILFALLRHKLVGTPWEARMASLLEIDGAPDGPGRYRLAPQPTIETFFRNHVQSSTAISESIDDFGASEVEGNILNNRQRLDERLTEIAEEGGDLAALAEFLLTRCLLVLEIIDNETDNEAWKMLQTEEDTGLPFHNSARAKVTLIETMPVSEREEASKKWDRCQAQLGDGGMQQLVSHVRSLSGRQRSSQPVEKDIVTRFKLDQRGLEFMDQQLVPSANRLTALRTHEIGRDAERNKITRYLQHMEWAGHSFWCVPAMRWLESNGDAHSDTTEFFRRLARKVWLLRISGADMVEYERRFISLSNEISDGQNIGSMSELLVPSKSLDKVRENLLSRTFYDKRYSRPVLRYLSDLMGKDSGEIEGDKVTIEHVLPRNPGKKSRWKKHFHSEKEISNYAHRIGNLALLSFKDNQTVGNHEFEEKRPFLTKSGFVLSIDAANSEMWTPDHIMDRSDALVRTMFEHWDLQL